MTIAHPEPSPLELQEAREWLRRLPRQRDQLLPALMEAQEALGWLPEWALALIGTHLRVPRSEVYGVATSFPDLRLERPAEATVRLCDGPACAALAPGLRAALEARLGVPVGQRAADRRVGLEAVPCLYLCGVAPVVEVNHALLGRATPEMVARAVAAALEGAV